MTKQTNGVWGAVATVVALVASCGETPAPEAASGESATTAHAIIGGEPEALPDFLERPESRPSGGRFRESCRHGGCPRRCPRRARPAYRRQRR
jgi:hypothetical protein